MLPSIASTASGPPAHRVLRNTSAAGPGSDATRPQPHEVGNASPPMLPSAADAKPPLPAAAILIDNIVTCEAQLIALMVARRNERTPNDPARAKGIIQDLNALRQSLAKHMRNDLWAWVRATHPPPRTLGDDAQDRLQGYLRHAGLDMLMQVSSLSELDRPQRIAIGERLRDAGCRTQILRTWLGLGETELGDRHALKLLDMLLSPAQSDILHEAKNHLEMLTNKNARRREAIKLSPLRHTRYLEAARIGRRFGYTDAAPPTSFMPNHMLDRRPHQLKELSQLFRGRQWMRGLVPP